MRSGRDHKDTEGAISLLPEVDDALEVGGFVGYRFDGNARGQGALTVELNAAKDVNDGHGGVVAQAQASYALARQPRFFANVDVQASYGDKDMMRAYYGVTSEQAAASGLRAYDVGSGLRDFGAGVTAGYQFNRRWGVIARVQTSRYVGDAADSPITDLGSKTKLIGGLGLSYRF